MARIWPWLEPLSARKPLNPFKLFLFSSLLLSSLEMSDTKVYEPQIRARLGTAAHFCKVFVLKLFPLQGRHPRATAADAMARIKAGTLQFAKSAHSETVRHFFFITLEPRDE